MNDDNLSPEQIQAINKAFDNAITNGPWDKTTFLRVVGKRLEKIRDDFLSQVGVKSSSNMETSSNLANRVALRSGQQEIYIALYSSSGNKLSAWERSLPNLPRQLISRPIYADENNVKAIIKSKSLPQNEAYVCAYVNQDDIQQIPEAKIPHDKLGNQLLTLKDRAISLDDITRFVHLSNTYYYKEGRLVKKNESPEQTDTDN